MSDIAKIYEGYETDYLRVIKKSDENTQKTRNDKIKNKVVFWDCECKACGTIFPVSVKAIDRTKSCGCYKRYKNVDREIGNKYGKLTIIDVDKERTEHEYSLGKSLGLFFKCQCECGTVKTYRFNSIQNGHIKSCGCSKFNNPLIVDDLTGRKFHRLTVLHRDIERDTKDRKYNVTHWVCQCECGNITSVTGYQLKSGHTKSCGCYLSDMLAERNKEMSTKINHTYHKNNGHDELGEYMIIYDDYGNSCIVDVDDYDFLKNWYWRMDVKGYWVTNSKQNDGYDKSTLRMHQLVAERKYGKYDTTAIFPDHLSRNKSDNRKCNLILKSNADNMKNRSLSKANTSGKTGVYYAKDKNMWVAAITVNYKTISLGEYKNFEDAVNARIRAEEEYNFTCDDKVAAYDIDKTYLS